MLRLSVIGLETTHGYIYPAMINGYDPDHMKANARDIVSNIFPTAGNASVSGARIVACYDEDPLRAVQVADACLIERVCPTLEDAYRDVDGVVITSGDAALHRALATPALEAGLPTFVDKPFTVTVPDAAALFALSEHHGAPIFCTSAVRFADQTVALREQLTSTIGTPLAAHVIGNGDYASYAVHTVEFLISVWGGGATRLRSLGQEGFDTVQLDYPDGRRAIWQVCLDLEWGFHLTVFGTDGVDGTEIRFADRYNVFKNTAEQIVRFMERRENPVPPAETLEIVRQLEAVPARRGSSESVSLV